MYSILCGEILPRLIPPNSKLLVAVSGGPDSVALAHILWRYINDRPDQNLSMLISHVNHKVRKEAEAEAELVRSLARILDVPYILHEFNAKKNACRRRQSFQEASRDWRYARWQEDMKKYGCNLLATAHHLGDQAETVLFRLIRGSGTAGLAGIYPAKDNIIRPLLSFSKEEILLYCLVQNLAYAVDQSNLEPLYDRNRIRIELLPELKTYNPRIMEALGRTAELSRWDEEYIGSQVDRVWLEVCLQEDSGKIMLSNKAWAQSRAILSRILRKAAAIINNEPRGLDNKYIKLIMKEGQRAGWRQDLPGIKVEASGEGIFLTRKEPEERAEPCYFEFNLIPERWVMLPELDLKAGIFRQLASMENIMWITEFDEEKVRKLEVPLVCRLRKAGDKMFFSRVGHKEIKKVFQDKGVQPQERQRIPVFAYGNSVVWIPGVSRSDCLLPLNDFSGKIYGLIAKL